MKNALNSFKGRRFNVFQEESKNKNFLRIFSPSLEINFHKLIKLSTYVR